MEEQRALGRQAKEEEARKARKRAAAAEAKERALASEGMVKPNQSEGGHTLKDLERNLALLGGVEEESTRAPNSARGRLTGNA